MTKQITIKELMEIAHIKDNNHLATIVLNYYFATSERFKQNGQDFAAEHYLNMWESLLNRLDKLED